MFYKHELVKCVCSDDQLHYVGCDCASSRQVGYTVTVCPRGYFAEDTTHVAVLAPEGTRAVEFEVWAMATYGIGARTPYAVRRDLPPQPSVSAECAAYWSGDNS